MSETGVPESENWEQITSSNLESAIVANETKIASVTNGRTGNLTLKKTVNNNNSVQNAKFTVTLWIPSAAAVANSHITINGNVTNTSTNAINSSDTTLSLGTATDETDYKKYTVQVDVPKGSTGATIKHLPYGTKYTVVEDSSSYPNGIYNNTTVSDEVTTAQEIGTTQSAPTITITNTYPEKGNLVLKKDLGANAATHSIGGESQFTFEVTLTPPTIGGTAMSLDTFINNYLGGSGNASTNVSDIATKYVKFDSTNSSGTNYDKVKKQFTVTKNQSDGSSPVKIEGLPYGTTYTVEEIDASKVKTSSVVGVDKTITHHTAGHIDVAESEYTITNTYPTLQNLDLYKVVENNNTSTVDANAKYIFTVTLKKGSGTRELTEYPIQVASTLVDTDTYDSTNHQYVLSVPVDANNATAVQISGIPDNATYNVVESNQIQVGEADATAHPSGTGLTTTYSYDSNNNYGVLNDSDKPMSADHTVYVKNTYLQTDSLNLKKVVSGTRPGGTLSSYKLKVTLNAPTGVSFANYNIVWPDNSEVVGTPTNTQIVYNVPVAPTADDNNYNVSISGLPYGTTYDVVEDDTASARESTVGYTFTDNSEKEIGNATADNVKVTNTYVDQYSLTLKKALNGSYSNAGIVAYDGDDATTDTPYTFTVELTPPTGITAAHLKEYYLGNSNDYSLISSDTKLQRTITMYGNDTTGVTISGLPKNTKYTVTETAKNDGSTPSIAITGGNTATINNLTTGEKTLSTNNDTVVITNTYPTVRNLVLQKRKDGTNPTGVPNADGQYTLRVTLTNPSPSTGLDISSYTITQIGAVSLGTLTASSGSYYIDVVMLAGSENDVTLSGIPEGVTYAVEELTASKAGTNNVTVVYADNDNSTSPYTIGTSQTVTVTNYYPAIGGLTLIKDVSGDRPSNTDNDYVFHVELTAPYDEAHGNYVELSDYTITYPDVTNSNATVTLDSNHYSNHKYTFDVTVPYNSTNNTGVTVSGIPFGTSYNVSETISDYPGVNSYDGPKTGEIGSSNSVTLTNTYGNVRSLILQKTLDADADDHDVSNKEFTYSVTLTDSNLTNYPLTISGSGGINTSPVTPNTSPYTFTVKVKPGESNKVTISGMPDGTTYSVYETDTLPTGTSVYKTGDSLITVSSSNPLEDTITGTTPPVVDITNDYESAGTLTLKKSVQNRTASEVPSAKFNVTLLIPDTVDVGNQNITVTGNVTDVSNNTISNTDISLGLGTVASESGYYPYTFSVIVPNNDIGVTIKHLPYGTQYYVLEDLTSYPDGIHDGKVTGEIDSEHKKTIANDNKTPTETITNTYLEKGTLKFKKNALVNPGSITTPSTFTFEVTLNKPSDMPIDKFIANYMGSNNVKTVADAGSHPEYYTSYFVNESGTLKRRYEMTAGANWTSIENLPYGTTYTVTEVDGSQVNTSGVTGEVKSADNAQIGATNEVAITNTYPNVGDLTLYKDFAAGTNTNNTYDDTVFYYTVTLNKPENTIVDLRDFINQSNLPSGTISGDGDTMTITGIQVKKSDTNGIKIQGVPYNTTYTVEEVLTTGTGSQTAAGWKTFSDEYGNTTNTKHYIGVEDANNTNSYKATNVKTDSLVLSKAIADGTTDSATDFIYKVVLTAPSGIDFDATNGNYAVSNITTTRAFETTSPYTSVTTAQTAENQSTYTFYVKVNAGNNGSVTVGGIPDGTTYEVTEVGQGDEWKNVKTAYGDKASDELAIPTIDGTTDTVTITNAKVGKLEVKKTTEGLDTIPSDLEFTVHVVLTSPSLDVDIQDYLSITELNDLDYISDATYTPKDENTTPKKPSKIELNVTLKPTTDSANNVKEISGIPYGTTYVISEPNTKGASVSYKVNILSTENI